MPANSAFPIILTHGIARFDVFWKNIVPVDNQDDPVQDLLHYFCGVRTFLRSKGFDVHHSSVPWAENVESRAARLKKNVLSVLAKTGAKKVNLIAHSMGGLDARHMLFSDKNDGKVHEKIASLTTIGTPHLGTSFADEGLRAHGDLIEVVR
ncbi:MAG: esterase/lipase family protein, partial [Vicinamibacteria bacterium]